MKSTIKKSTYKAIYRLLDHVSPLHSDCGELCDAACCTPVEELSTENEEDFQLGIYDDEREIADLIEVYLQNKNYTVFKSYTAEDAL